MHESLPDSDAVLAQFNRLIQELLRGSMNRNLGVFAEFYNLTNRANFGNLFGGASGSTRGSSVEPPRSSLHWPMLSSVWWGRAEREGSPDGGVLDLCAFSAVITAPWRKDRGSDKL